MSTRKPATGCRIHHRDCSKQNLTTAVGMGMGHPDPSRWWTAQRSAGCSAVWSWSCVIGRFPEPSDPAGWMVVCILRAGALVRYHGLDLGLAHTPAAASHLRYGTLCPVIPILILRTCRRLSPLCTPPLLSELRSRAPASKYLDRYLQGRSCLRAAAAWTSGSSAALQVRNSSSSQPKTIVALVLPLRLPPIPRRPRLGDLDASSSKDFPTILNRTYVGQGIPPASNSPVWPTNESPDPTTTVAAERSHPAPSCQKSSRGNAGAARPGFTKQTVTTTSQTRSRQRPLASQSLLPTSFLCRWSHTLLQSATPFIAFVSRPVCQVDSDRQTHLEHIGASMEGNHGTLGSPWIPLALPHIRFDLRVHLHRAALSINAGSGIADPDVCVFLTARTRARQTQG